MRKLFLVFALAFVASIGIGQDLSGYWEGECKKWENDGSPYFMSMEIKQEGVFIEGEAKIKYKDKEWYCVTKIKGVVIDGGLRFKDMMFVEHHHDSDNGWYWLLREGFLRYSMDEEGEELKNHVNAYDYTIGAMYENYDYIVLKRKKVKFASL